MRVNVATMMCCCWARRATALGARRCLALALVTTAVSWLTLHLSLLDGPGRRRWISCLGDYRRCLVWGGGTSSGAYSAGDDEDEEGQVAVKLKEMSLALEDAGRKLGAKTFSAGEGGSARTKAATRSSKYSEYGKVFHQTIMKDVFKYGKRRRPWYNFPKSQVGELSNRTLKEVLCDVKRHPPYLLTDQTPPFDVNPLGKYLHQDDPILKGKTFKTCACVSSSGLLKGRKLGKFIDSHDLVLRMNKAPVVGYEKDVGSKTTIRILNNSVLRWINDKRRLVKPWEFPDSINSTLIVWEACAEKGPFIQCLADYETEYIRKLQGESMQPFFKWRKNNMHRELYFLHPDWLWDLWELLQRFTPTTIIGHVPTTGFIAFGFLMHFCEEISVFELIPSMDYRERQPCYYFDGKESVFCYMNGYHPKKAEISMFLGLNVGSMEQVYRDGYATIPGLANLDCSQN